MCGLDWLFTRLNNWLWFSGFYGGLFSFSSFISSGDAAFIHAWALESIQGVSDCKVNTDTYM